VGSGIGSFLPGLGHPKDIPGINPLTRGKNLPILGTVSIQTPKPDAESDTRRKVRQMASAGLSVREMARALGISTQRVHQQLKAIERDDAKNGSAA
jgi:DNA invertase Pin-like site-specific DNA recombinase